MPLTLLSQLFSTHLHQVLCIWSKWWEKFLISIEKNPAILHFCSRLYSFHALLTCCWSVAIFYLFPWVTKHLVQINTKFLGHCQEVAPVSSYTDCLRWWLYKAGGESSFSLNWLPGLCWRFSPPVPWNLITKNSWCLVDSVQAFGFCADHLRCTNLSKCCFVNAMFPPLAMSLNLEDNYFYQYNFIAIY